MKYDGWTAGLTALVLLTALGLVCPLLAAPHVPLADPDEGLHASIAQEMVERGDWIVPRQLQDPFLDKPILYFWAIAASLKAFGNSEAAVRLPGLLFGMLGTLTTVAIAARTMGRRTGVMAGIFYASMVLPLALLQLPAHDVALVPWVNLALLCFWEADRSGRSPGFSRNPDTKPAEAVTGKRGQSPFVRSTLRAVPANGDCPRFPGTTSAGAWILTALAGLVLGLSVLTKGLAGIAIVGVAYGGYLLVSRQLRAVHFLRAALSLFVAAAVASAWYFAVEQASPGFIRYYFFERHVLGFLTNSQPHGGAPWWYYFPILLVGGLPWIAYLPVLLRDTLTRRRGGVPPMTDDCGRRPLLFVGCWFIGCTLFLTASHSKLVTYIWPVFPAMAILAAVVWLRQIDGLMHHSATRWMAVVVWTTCFFGTVALPLTFAVTEAVLPTQFSARAWALAVAAGLTSLTPAWAWMRGRMRLTVAFGAGTVCCQLCVLLFLAFPRAAEALSARDLAMHYNQTRVLPSRIMLAQERVGSVLFYLDPDLRAQLQPGQVANQDIDDPLPTPPMGEDEWVAIPERHVHTMARNYDLHYVPYERAGAFRLYRRSDLEPHALAGLVEKSLFR